MSRSIYYALMTSIVNINTKLHTLFHWLLEQPCPWMSLFHFTNNDTKATQIGKHSGQDLNPVLLYSKVQANVLQDALMQIVVLMPHGQRVSI